MRVLYGRGDWRPGFRIESLRRYAFIGDSHAYGSGVAPDETLSANAERQMNELLPAWPVEAVNLGVSGYNLWNSWLAFKHGPQVYDGVVLVLCSNDADLFDRTYQVKYLESEPERWESNHPFGAAVARCFDDIVSFSQERSLPVAIVYSSAFRHSMALRIGEIINELCASRGLCFIDTFAHYRDRNFPFADLFVSSANMHPSAMAHEATGRHLVATLRRRGWFREYEASAIAAAPDRILEAARAMLEKDHYPPDAALNWALHALDAKSHLARRLQALGADDDFSATAARVTDALTTASRRWHMANRTRACLLEVANPGTATSLSNAEEERLRLEELAFVLGTGDWNRLSARLLEVGVPRQTVPEAWPSDAPAFFHGCNLNLVPLLDVLDGLRGLAAPAVIGSPHDEALMLRDLEALERLANRAETQCTELKQAFLRLERIFGDMRPTLSEAEISQVSSIVGGSFKRVRETLGFVMRLLAATKGIRKADYAPFTTVEVTISAKAIEGQPFCLISGKAEYNVPNRFPFSVSGWFNLDGSPNLVKLYFPLFYAGRLFIQPYVPKTLKSAEAALTKVELYNGTNQRRSVPPASFHRESGRFISPVLYLP
jgi:hypothetical protein